MEEEGLGQWLEVPELEPGQVLVAAALQRGLAREPQLGEPGEPGEPSSQEEQAEGEQAGEEAAQ